MLNFNLSILTLFHLLARSHALKLLFAVLLSLFQGEDLYERPSSKASSLESNDLILQGPKDQECGTLRFSVKFYSRENRLNVTVLDAIDLPALDACGTSDPYVEVSIRPLGTKFTTQIKTKCLNPTFNESFDFTLTEEQWNDPKNNLVLKLKDKDYGAIDELIGVIRLPLDMLDLTQDKTYSCLVLHGGTGKNKNGGSISAAAAAKLNLKISALSSSVYQLEQQIVRRQSN